jgi:integrase
LEPIWNNVGFVTRRVSVGRPFVASIHKNEESGRWYVRFRWGARNVQRSLGTDSLRKAQSLLGRIRLTLDSVQHGLIEAPETGDPIDFLLSGGTRKETLETQQRRSLTIKELLKRYADDLPKDSKAATTLVTEAVHHKHLIAGFGARTIVQEVSLATLQAYVTKRAATGVAGATIRKEVASLRVAWNYAVAANLIPDRSLPVRGLRYPRLSEKPPFRTAAEIRTIIERNKLTDDEADTLWDSLFLDLDEVRTLVTWVEEHSPHPWFSVAVSVAAWTGCRRSELCRIEVGDVDLSSDVLTVRERKRDTSRKETTRQVQIGPTLKRVLKAHIDSGESKRWLLEFKGGQTNPEQLRDQWRRLREGSPWEMVTGFHVLRHSFISNCAARGVPQAVIDSFAGHQTDEQRRRYRHLFPSERKRAIEALEGLPPDTAKVPGG